VSTPLALLVAPADAPLGLLLEAPPIETMPLPLATDPAPQAVSIAVIATVREAVRSRGRLSRNFQGTHGDFHWTLPVCAMGVTEIKRIARRHANMSSIVNSIRLGGWDRMLRVRARVSGRLWVIVLTCSMAGCHRAPSPVADLAWTVPTTNTDGTPLTDLAGYRIYYGQSPGALNQSIAIHDPHAIHYTFRNLAAGTWYFRVTCINSAAVESAMSPVVAYTVR
jgi:hypothetical protein